MLDFLASAASGVLNWFGGERNRDTQMQIANNNIALQREFAQNGLSWKIADAMRNKDLVHPAYSLGASTTSFSPVSVGGDMGGGLSDIGQDVSRAIMATKPNEDRDMAKALSALQLERGGLENELLRTQIRNLNAQVGPGMPTRRSSAVVPGQGDSAPPPVPEHTGLRIGDGSTMPTDPTVSDAQKFEDRYGESSDFTWGPYIQLRDWLYRRNRGYNSFPTPDAAERAAVLRARMRQLTGDRFVPKRYRD